MKTIVILLLLVALVAGAVLSRPKPESFDAYFRAQAAASHDNAVMKFIAKGFSADLALHDYHYKDRWLWATVEKDGKVVYTGVFNHWFKLSDSTSK